MNNKRYLIFGSVLFAYIIFAVINHFVLVGASAYDSIPGMGGYVIGQFLGGFLAILFIGGIALFVYSLIERRRDKE